MKNPWLAQLVFAAAIAAVGCTAKLEPDAATIRKMESKIVVPRLDGGPHQPTLADFARYYAASTSNSHRTIVGEMVIPFGPPTKSVGIYVVGSKNEFPAIFNGGCAVLYLVYDIDTEQVISLKCGGYG